MSEQEKTIWDAVEEAIIAGMEAAPASLAPIVEALPTYQEEETMSEQPRQILDSNYPENGECVKCGDDDLEYQGDTPYQRPMDGVTVHYNEWVCLTCGTGYFLEWMEDEE